MARVAPTTLTNVRRAGDTSRAFAASWRREHRRLLQHDAACASLGPRLGSGAASLRSALLAALADPSHEVLVADRTTKADHERNRCDTWRQEAKTMELPCAAASGPWCSMWQFNVSEWSCAVWAEQAGGSESSNRRTREQPRAKTE